MIVFLVCNKMNRAHLYLQKISGHSLLSLTGYKLISGDDASNHGQNNPKFGNIHDFSKAKSTVYYLKPRMSGRYTSLESLRELRMVFKEIEIYSESMREFCEERRDVMGRMGWMG